MALQHFNPVGNRSTDQSFDRAFNRAGGQQSIAYADVADNYAEKEGRVREQKIMAALTR